MSSPLYVKTDKGRQEIETRAGGLPAKLRRLLIMIDGRKTLDELMSQTGLSIDMDSMLQQLQDGGYVDLEGVAPPSLAQAASWVPVQSVVTSTNIPSAPAPVTAVPQYGPVSEVDLATARGLMLECARIYLGLMGAALVRRIEAAAGEAALRACVPAWHMALRESKSGRAVAETHFHTVRDILHVEDD